jgi:hypothetical protein
VRVCLQCRTDALQRFALLQVQWQQLAAQLRPLAKHYVAHPKVGWKCWTAHVAHAPAGHYVSLKGMLSQRAACSLPCDIPRKSSCDASVWHCSLVAHSMQPE